MSLLHRNDSNSHFCGVRVLINYSASKGGGKRSRKWGWIFLREKFLSPFLSGAADGDMYQRNKLHLITNHLNIS